MDGMHRWDAWMGCMNGMHGWDASMGCMDGMHERDAWMGNMYGIYGWDAWMGCIQVSFLIKQSKKMRKGRFPPYGSICAAFRFNSFGFVLVFQVSIFVSHIDNCSRRGICANVSLCVLRT